MKLKDCLAINDRDVDHIMIFNMDTDECIELNEEASLIFLNRIQEREIIKQKFKDEYNIKDEARLDRDIDITLKYFEDNFYEK